VVLHLNSLGDEATRPAYQERLRAHFQPLVGSMSEDARATLDRNPMRLLDSKEEALRPAIASAPALLDVIDDASRAHFDQVRRFLDAMGIAYTLDPTLVRGLDYYTRTTFEFIYQPSAGENALGTAGTVCGGGRYDGLVKALGGPDKPGVGFAMGLDRLVLLAEALGRDPGQGPQLFIGTFDGPLREAALALVMRLRNLGLRVDFDPRGGKLGRQNERADKVGARYFAVYGQAEHERGQLTLKDLTFPRDTPDTHPGKLQQIAVAELATWLRAQQAPG
jgi:histidyl-tRNA synthetase